MGESHIPDSISRDQLRSLLGRSPEMPLSDVFPVLNLGCGESTPGGMCDLQFAIMQIIQQSQSGTNLLQELTAALYLIHSVGECLARRSAEAADNTGPFASLDNRDQVIALEVLASYRMAHRAVIEMAEHLHISFMSSAAPEYIHNLRLQLGSQATDENLRSHLMLSECFLESVGLERASITEYINRFDRPDPSDP